MIERYEVLFYIVIALLIPILIYTKANYDLLHRQISNQMLNKLREEVEKQEKRKEDPLK